MFKRLQTSIWREKLLSINNYEFIKMKMSQVVVKYVDMYQI